MNTRAKIIIGILVAVAGGLGIAVGVMAAGNDDRSDGRISNHMDRNDNGYLDMMGAMGSMDSDDLLRHMHDVLGEDGYKRMLAHFRDHRNGGPMTGDADVDQMMHTMMDGMMRQMPMGSGTVLPPVNGQHHESRVPATTPTP